MVLNHKRNKHLAFLHVLNIFVPEITDAVLLIENCGEVKEKS